MMWRSLGQKSLALLHRASRGGVRAWRYLPKTESSLSALIVLIVVLFVASTQTIQAANNPVETIAGWVGTLIATPLLIPINGLLTILAWITAALVALVGLIFDYTLWYTVVQNPVQVAYSGIIIGWTIIRDFANLFFIFILVYIGIMTMLQSSGFNTKQLLVKVVTMALLINFSFFLTSLVIDLSNAVSYQVYRAIVPEFDPGIESGTSLSNMVLLASGAETIFQWNDFTNVFSGSTGLLTLVVRLTLQVLMIWVMLQMIILFIARAAAFMFLIVLSPAAFMADILPGSRKYFNQWKETLIGQALVAPVFLFFLLVIIRIMQALRGTFAGVDESLPADIGSVSSAFIFILCIFLLLQALKITKQFAGDIGKTALGIGGSVAGLAIGGLAGAGLRTFAPAVINRASRMAKLDDASISARREAGIENTFTGRQMLKLQEFGNRQFKTAAGGSFDIRNAKIPGATKDRWGNLAQTVGETSRAQGFNLGIPSERQSERVDRIAKDDKKRIAALNADPARQAAYFNSLSAARQAEYYENASPRERAAIEERLKDVRGISSSEVDTRFKGFRSRMSVEDREKTEKEIRETRTSREQSGFRNYLEMQAGVPGVVTPPGYTAPAPSITEAVKKIKPKESNRLLKALETAPAPVRQEIIRAMSPNQLGDLMANSDLSNNEALVAQLYGDIDSAPDSVNKTAQLAHINNNLNRANWRR